MTGTTPRILGTGYAVPGRLRGNDDPVFDALKREHPDGANLFTGYDLRHVLSDGEGLIDIMAPAARLALEAAGVGPQDIDLVIGDASVSDALTPNAVSELHKVLGLPAHCWPLTVSSAFSQVNAAVVMADALIRAGRARHVLIAMADNWTRHVDYLTPQAVSAADGAAACVLGPMRSAADWGLVDCETLADTSYYGSMRMAGDVLRYGDGHDGHLMTHPFFQITAAGLEGFTAFALDHAGDTVTRLLARNGVAAADICLITHQASATLMDHWAQQIGPGHYVNTIRSFANVVQCSVLLNLAWATRNDTGFLQDHLVTLCLGPDMHASAMLLRRNA